MKTVLANYKTLITFFEELLNDQDVDSTVVAKASGFLERMESFQFLFLLNTMVEIFDRIEILNTDLQKSELCVVDSYRKIEAVTIALDASRDSKFELIWLKSNKLTEEFDIEEPNLPRKRRIPKRIDNSNVENHVFKTPKDYYRKVYYEVFDQVLSSLKSRFDTDSAKFFKTLESFVVGEMVDVNKIIKFYNGDFDELRLVNDKDMALNILNRKGKNPATLKDVVEALMIGVWALFLNICALSNY